MADPQLKHPSATHGGGEAHRTALTETLLPALQPMAGPGEEPGTEPALPHAPRPSAAAIVATVALALLGFTLTAGLIHLGIRRPLYLRADIRSGKLQLLEETRGQVFSAAFGSSHVHNGFDPRAFDRALASTPLATRSVNLAVAGGSQTEQRVMALEFVRSLRTPPRSSSEAPPQCLVLLELGAGANFLSDHLVHPRAINIYDRDTAGFVATLTSPGMSREQAYGRRAFAEAAMALHYLNVGMLSFRYLPFQ